MELKKSLKSDLERKRKVFFQFGLILALTAVLIAFELPTKPSMNVTDKLFDDMSFDSEEIIPTIREEPEQIHKQKLVEILTIVQNDFNIDDVFTFDPEATPETEFQFDGFMYEPEKFDEDQTFTVVEEMPKFNGGEPATEFRKYIFQNLSYPDIASGNGISGKVLVQFTIDSKGKLVDAVVLIPVDPALDKEALRVVMSSPLWTPGRQRGKAVKVLYTFPISFKLQ